MKTITFRPLRLNRKLGKIIVASYLQWRKVKTADRSGLYLIIDNEYKTMNPESFVYNHAGKQLFWINFDPDEIPVLNRLGLNDGELLEYPKRWKTDYGMYSATNLDCDGVPVFSHYTLNRICSDESVNKVQDHVPLTVEIVTRWFGWFLYQLENNRLQIGR